PTPQPQALETSFEARVRDYIAAHTERMERFKNAIFKRREEINGRLTEMFGFLKELITSKASEKVLIREAVKSPITKNVNSIFLVKKEEEDKDKHNVTIGETNETNNEVSVKESETNNKAENGVKNKPIKKVVNDKVVEAPSSRPEEYYLKHRINKKLIEGLVDNPRFNDSGARVGKVKGKTYNVSPRGPVYDAILKKKITKKEDIKGNFEIPCSIAGLKQVRKEPFTKDVLIEVSEHVYPVDFMILDIKDDEKRPFILGVPFLTTVQVVIKFDKGTITLRSRKSKISFHRIPEPLYKTERGVKNEIEPIAPSMTMNRLVLEWEEGIRLHQEKEMELDQRRRKNFKNKHPTPTKDDKEVGGKEEVT
nr:hypothetical protein [Tanacetum cinerariifolium]